MAGGIKVIVLAQARAELLALPTHERNAMARAIEKLEALGDALGYPHSGQVQGTSAGVSIRELRPRQGRSPWRAFYQRRGNQIFVVAAIGSEAVHNQRAFDRAVAAAIDRLADLGDQEPR